MVKKILMLGAARWGWPIPFAQIEENRVKIMRDLRSIC